MIGSLGFTEESNKYRLGELCPEIFDQNDEIKESWMPSDSIKNRNITAVEGYVKALIQELPKSLKLVQKEPVVHKAILDPSVRENLEKVAAKNFIPSFNLKTSEQEIFKTFIKHAKYTTEKYSEISKTHKEPTSIDNFVLNKAPSRDKAKQEQKGDQAQYAGRLKARINVYRGWEFKEVEDNQNKFILNNQVNNQQITVTKKEDGSFVIQYTSNSPVLDETIGIMIELSHSLVRFSKSVNNADMKLKVQQVSSDPLLLSKFKEGFGIINNYNNKPEQEKLNYNFE